MKKEQNETYRGLMAKIVQNLDRSHLILPRGIFPQWIRMNKGSTSEVQAAEDYIPPPTSIFITICQENHFIIQGARKVKFQRSQKWKFRFF